jgi:nucleoside-diphosphate-sugar epimerase
VLGRALLPHLRDHDVVALTRRENGLRLVAELGAHGMVCDAYDRERLVAIAQEARPDVVVNFLTDLAGGIGPQNARIRLEAGPHVVDAAKAACARRLVVESVAFPLEGEGQAAVEALERGALESGLEAVVLRFAMLWGPGTWHPEAPEGRRIHVEDAGRRAAEFVLHGPPGVHVID